MRIKLLLLALIIFESAHAQIDSLRSPIAYFNQFLAGGQFGSDMPATLSASMAHGIRVRRWSFAAGVGYDMYGSEWRVNPFFLQGSFAFASNAASQLFLDFKGGTSAVTRVAKLQDGYNYSSDYGRMLQPGLGYRLLADKWSIYVLVGYRSQKINYTQTLRWWPGTPVQELVTERSSNRFILQIGFGLR